MKSKKFSKKLEFSKATVAALDSQEKANVKGGYLYTNMYDNCYTWDPICPTQYIYICTYKICPDTPY